MITRGNNKDCPEGDNGCVMEITSRVAGLRWSDAPECTHPLIRNMAIRVNDSLPRDERQKLGDLVERLAVAYPTEESHLDELYTWIAKSAIRDNQEPDDVQGLLEMYRTTTNDDHRELIARAVGTVVFREGIVPATVEWLDELIDYYFSIAFDPSQIPVEELSTSS